MNNDTLTGSGTDLKGKFKETMGDATGDSKLQQDGLSDQLTGKAQKGVGAVRDFARNRPVVAATLAGVVGIAILNTLRGKQSY